MTEREQLARELEARFEPLLAHRVVNEGAKQMVSFSKAEVVTVLAALREPAEPTQDEVPAPLDGEVREIVERLRATEEVEGWYDGGYRHRALRNPDGPAATALIERLSSAQQEAVAAEREACARIAERRAEERFNENGTREWDTNATYYSGRAAELYESLDEEDEAIATVIRARGEG